MMKCSLNLLRSYRGPRSDYPPPLAQTNAHLAVSKRENSIALTRTLPKTLNRPGIIASRWSQCTHEKMRGEGGVRRALCSPHARTQPPQASRNKTLIYFLERRDELLHEMNYRQALVLQLLAQVERSKGSHFARLIFER